MSNVSKQKIQKLEEKKCPECDEYSLIIIRKKHDINGVIYEDAYDFCESCYYEKIRKHRNKYKDEED